MTIFISVNSDQFYIIYFYFRPDALTLKWLGFTINTMSLGGVTIAVGDLVYNAIIDVENVLKHLKENAKLPKEQQKNKLTVIFNASFGIRHSIVNSTFIIIIIAFPTLFFLSGMEGKILAQLGTSIIVSKISPKSTAKFALKADS